MTLIAHWKLDDNAASTTVVATVGSNGTLTGGDNTNTKATTGPGGSITAAFDLNGTDDAITVSLTSVASGTAGSWSIWFTIDAVPTALIGASGAAASNSIRITTDTEVVVRFGGTGSTFVLPSLGTATWHHLLITKTTGNSVRAFLDGTESVTGALTNAGTFTPNSIGRTSTVFHGGKIAWVKEFDSDESANVATIYAEGVSGGGGGNANLLRGKLRGGLLLGGKL